MGVHHGPDSYCFVVSYILVRQLLVMFFFFLIVVGFVINGAEIAKQ